MKIKYINHIFIFFLFIYFIVVSILSLNKDIIPGTLNLNDPIESKNIKLIANNSIDEKLFLSARNLKDVGIATVDYLDPALMLSFKNILIVKEAIEGFEKRFGG